MYAIFEAKGKQFRATPDQRIRMPSLGAEPGDRVTFDTVLLAQRDADGDVLIGRPSLKGASVDVEVLRHGKEDKIVVYKMKRRKGYRRKQGHRQKFTEVRVVEIDFGTGESVKSPEKAEPKKTKTEKKTEPKKAKAKAEKAETAKPKPEAKVEEPTEAPEAEAADDTPAAEAAEIDVTPAAAELAEEEGIDLTTLEGTGKDGRILKSDVQGAIKAREGD